MAASESFLVMCTNLTFPLSQSSSSGSKMGRVFESTMVGIPKGQRAGAAYFPVKLTST